MGSIKDRNDVDLTEAEILRRGGRNTQKNCTKKDLHDPDNHEGVIAHLEPDILECEVRWALESITTNKASGGDGIPVELFQILKGQLPFSCLLPLSQGDLPAAHCSCRP